MFVHDVERERGLDEMDKFTGRPGPLERVALLYHMAQ